MKSIYFKYKKQLFLLIKLVISAGLFIIITKSIFKKETIDLISLLSFKLIFVVAITGLFQIAINSIIQRNLLGIYNLQFPLKNILLHNYISTIYILAIPGFFAPDFYLGYYYGKENKDYGRIISALFINRLIGITTFFFLAGIALIILGSSFVKSVNINATDFGLRYIIIALFGLSVISIVLVVFFKDRLNKFKIKLFQIWEETKNSKNILIQALFLKLGFNIIGLLGRLAIGYLIGVKLPILEFASIILILNFLISLPISINGVGVREIGYVGLLSILGVSKTTAFSFALGEFGITLFGALVGVTIFITLKSKGYLNIKTVS